MNKTWQDGIVRAYDEKFQVLELARKDYAEFVHATLKKIKNLLERQNNNRIRMQRSEIGFAQDYLEIRRADWPEKLGMYVICRMAAPWDGEPGNLQLGMAVHLEDKLDMNPVSFGELNEIAPIIDDKQSGASVMDELPDRWVWGENLYLGTVNLPQAVEKRIAQFLGMIEDFLIEKENPWRYAVILEKVLAQLEKDELPDGFNKVWIGSSWHGQRFVQMNGKPNYWVAYHVKNRKFMYGHNKLDSCKDLPEYFARKMNMVLGEHGGCPSGIFISIDEMDDQEDDKLVEELANSFSKFAEAAKSCGKNDNAQ